MKNTKTITKTVIRTLVYQLVILFTGFSIGFLSYPQYWGQKTTVINRSIKNIFFHPKFDDVKNSLINAGRLKTWAHLDFPENLNFSNEKMIGEDRYVCDYEYKINKETIKGSYETFIRWKSWEANYELPETIE